MGSSSNHNNDTSSSSRQDNRNHNGFDYGSSPWDNDGTTTTTTTAPRYQVPRTNDRNSFDSSFGSSGYDNSYHNNHTSSNMSSSSPMPMDYQQDSGSGSGGPLCPGHNMPCRLLTANTSTNPGRQFYKCAMPDDQKCDFFEWADDDVQENNWNNLVDDGGGNGGAIDQGNVKDMHRENLRIFGHRSFRPGQKDAIEQAIRGRDVFVLMPTGGTLYLRSPTYIYIYIYIHIARSKSIHRVRLFSFLIPIFPSLSFFFRWQVSVLPVTSMVLSGTRCYCVPAFVTDSGSSAVIDQTWYPVGVSELFTRLPHRTG